VPRHAALARRNQRHGRRLLPGAEAACTDPVARVDTIVTALLSHDARPARGRRRRGVHKLREQGPDHVAPGSLTQVGLQRRRHEAFISLERLCGTQLELCAKAALLEAPNRPAAPTAAGPAASGPLRPIFFASSVALWLDRPFHVPGSRSRC